MAREFYIGRQEIFDSRRTVVGYELLYRQRENSLQADAVNGDQATSHVLMHSFWELGLGAVVGNHMAFVNLTRNFLLNPDLLPPPSSQLVLEILEDIVIDDTIIATVRDLKSRGYLIALDDFIYRDEFKPLLEISDIVKIDIQLVSGDLLREYIQLLRPYRLKLLAEKVETPETFEECGRLGFDYYQGYFLCRPHVLSARRLPANRINALRMMAQLQEPELNIKAIEEIISQDPTLSYRLLRHMQSAHIGLRKKVQSIRHAIVYVGEIELRRWAILIALAGIDDNPEALITTSLIRARMCELISGRHNPKSKASSFMMGLFSTLDAMLDQPLGSVLEKLPLSPEINDALLHHTGNLAQTLNLVLAYERGDWDAIEAFGNVDDIADIYLEALTWARETIQDVNRDTRVAKSASNSDSIPARRR
ncbi:MAG: EAL domain-containing protein [Chromatiales bacterium]|jgi:EAL and modified HD-GYP domain-containing signal transduction protein|nr:EAL domain-containing protein [Chromatiales bacterium]